MTFLIDYKVNQLPSQTCVSQIQGYRSFAQCDPDLKDPENLAWGPSSTGVYKTTESLAEDLRYIAKELNLKVSLAGGEFS